MLELHFQTSKEFLWFSNSPCTQFDSRQSMAAERVLRLMKDPRSWRRGRPMHHGAYWYLEPACCLGHAGRIEPSEYCTLLGLQHFAARLFSSAQLVDIACDGRRTTDEHARNRILIST